MATTADIQELQLNTPEDHALEFLRAIHSPSDVFEVRALGVDGRDNRIDSGVYDDPAAAVHDAIAVDKTLRPKGIYVTLNPCNPALLARTNNSMERWAKHTTKDCEILKRTCVTIDVDSVKGGGIAGISASAEEIEHVTAGTERVREFLYEQGFHEPIEIDSGNGRYLIYPVDLPNNDHVTEMLKRFFARLSELFSGPHIEVDKKVFNASRIFRLPGTTNRKGANIPDRPHRRSRLLYVPDYLRDGHAEPIPRETLEKVASSGDSKKTIAELPKLKTKKKASSVLERARQYLQQLPPAVSGQDGHSNTFLAAQHLVLGFDLSIEDALPLLQEWNRACQPPWSDAELRHKLEEAKSQGTAVSVGQHLKKRRSKGRNHGGPEAPDDPHRLAQLLVDDFTEAGNRTLHFWRGSFWKWDGIRYVEMTRDDVRVLVVKRTKQCFDDLVRNSPDD